MSQILYLESRALIKISGHDRESFLQGLVSNDVRRVSNGTAIYTWLMTPQGKYLCDFFVVPITDNAKKQEDFWLIDINKNQAKSLIKRLSVFKLRADIKLEDVSATYRVLAEIPRLNSDKTSKLPPILSLSHYTDPRLKTAGKRLIIAAELAENLPSGEINYNKFRLSQALPSAPDDLRTEKSLALESNLDYLNGLDWEKGCYMGQEVTARTKYRGLVKKRLLQFSIDNNNNIPNSGETIEADGKIIGEIRSATKNGKNVIGLALIRIDRLEKAKEENKNLSCNKSPIKVTAPNYF